MLALKAWLLAFLIFNMPPEWAQTRTGCEDVVPNELPDLQVKECTAAWSHGDKEIYAFVWEPFAPRPGGVMEAAEEIKGRLLGEDITIVRTKFFMGVQQEVLTAHLSVKEPEAQIMIYARNMSPDDFQAILDGVERAP